MSTALFDPIRAHSKIAREVIVGLSCGKDSVVTLDLCARFFSRVESYFMYLVPGLEYQESVLRHYERRYGIRVHRIPHFILSDAFRYGSFIREDYSVPTIGVEDSYAYIRAKTGLHWIACGERVADSTFRRGMILSVGSVWRQRGRFYPLAYWNKRDVLEYIKRNKLPVSGAHRVLGSSGGSLDPAEMAAIKQNFPRDWEKIKAFFPYIEAAVKAHEIRQNQQV